MGAKKFNQKGLDFIVKTSMEQLGINETQARMRLEALQRSGVLSKFDSPDVLYFQITVDTAMQIPQLGDERVLKFSSFDETIIDKNELIEHELLQLLNFYFHPNAKHQNSKITKRALELYKELNHKYQ